MNLFSANYFKPQYFNAAYLHGATAMPAQDGRSGYWRLFYYEMQEEALREKRDDQVPANAATQDTLVKREDIPVAAKSVRKKRVEKEEKLREPVLKPVYRQPAVVAEKDTLTPFLNTLSDEFRAWNFSTNALWVKMLSEKAANDEEDEAITLLLLAA